MKKNYPRIRVVIHELTLKKMLAEWLEEKGFKVDIEQSPDLIAKKDGKSIRIEIERKLAFYKHPENYCDMIFVAEGKYYHKKPAEVPIYKIPEEVVKKSLVIKIDFDKQSINKVKEFIAKNELPYPFYPSFYGDNFGIHMILKNSGEEVIEELKGFE